MPVLLIADMSEDFCYILREKFRKEYDVVTFSNGEAARDYLLANPVDALILDMKLAHLSGLELLEQIQHCRPPVILAVTAQHSHYVCQRGMELGVGYLLPKPCRADNIYGRLKDMAAQMYPCTGSVFQGAVSDILLRLRLPQERQGFRQLCIGVPLFIQDPGMLICKELYPAICNLGGYSDPAAVEHAIREVIKDGWARRDRELWLRIFPNHKDRQPTNKQFIARLAQLLTGTQDFHNLDLTIPESVI